MKMNNDSNLVASWYRRTRGGALLVLLAAAPACAVDDELAADEAVAIDDSAIITCEGCGGGGGGSSSAGGTVTPAAAAPPALPTQGVSYADFDGDRRADIGRWMQYNGRGMIFLIDYARNGWGHYDEWCLPYNSKDRNGNFVVGVPAPGDYDGDGKADVAVKYHNGYLKIDYMHNGCNNDWEAEVINHGGADNQITTGDYDGDGKDDASIKGTNGIWAINYASDGLADTWDALHRGYGDASFTAAPADYDGDGKTDIATKNTAGVWAIDYARNGFGAYDESHSGYGGEPYYPVPADYDGDGKADISISTDRGVWWFNYASDGFASGWNRHMAHAWTHLSSPKGVDLDGDGRADQVLTDSQKLIVAAKSSESFTAFTWSDALDPIGAPDVDARSTWDWGMGAFISAPGAHTIRHRLVLGAFNVPASDWKWVDSNVASHVYPNLGRNQIYCVEAFSWNGGDPEIFGKWCDRTIGF